jgi:hypothetical protein
VVVEGRIAYYIFAGNQCGLDWGEDYLFRQSGNHVLEMRLRHDLSKGRWLRKYAREHSGYIIVPFLRVHHPLYSPTSYTMTESLPSVSYPTPYQQIDKSSRDIRILILLPHLHPEDNRLQCSLMTESLSSNPSYEALSYTWGQPDACNLRVWVNGVLLPVRRNLLCALRVVRNDQERRLWIDALCIDQDNGLERGHQVRLMGEIYKHAWRVLAWLGTNDRVELEDEKLDVQSNTPRDVPVSPFDFPYAAYRGREPDKSRYRSERKDPGMDWVTKYFLDHELKETLEDFIKMCKMEYWTRL